MTAFLLVPPIIITPVDPASYACLPALPAQLSSPVSAAPTTPIYTRINVFPSVQPTWQSSMGINVWSALPLARPAPPSLHVPAAITLLTFTMEPA
jgi:hypothetical protein